MKNYKNLLTAAFLLLEGILYGLILTTGGELLIAVCFASIVLCFLYGLLQRGTPLLVAGAAATVVADFFLVVCGPEQRLAGVISFLVVQTCYALFLHRQDNRRIWLILRLVLILLITVIALTVLGDGIDVLALVSVWYYANLVMNMVMSFGNFRKMGMLGIGFLLFILCDTVIGLQVAAQSYLPIGRETLLYQILFMDFYLSWFFYLPSQVLIALSAVKNK